MYALQLRHQDRKYFHIRKEICPFIEAHYELLVPKTSIYPFHYSLVIPLSHQLTESISWRQTVNMTLSHPQYAHIFMQESQDHEHGRRKGNTHHYHNSLSFIFHTSALFSISCIHPYSQEHWQVIQIQLISHPFPFASLFLFT